MDRISEDVIGNGYRTIDYETNELRGVFPQTNAEDFIELKNGNKGIYLSYRINGQNYKGDFQLQIEFLHDYPSSPPNVYIVSPYLGVGTPHTLADQKMCYLMPAIDWNDSLTSYDVAIMIQTWIYAYCNWIKTKAWDWYQDYDNVPLNTEGHIGNEFDMRDHNINFQSSGRPIIPSQEYCYRIPIYAGLLNYDYATHNYGSAISNNQSIDNRIYEASTENGNAKPSHRVNRGKLISIILLSGLMLAINSWSFTVLPLWSLLYVHKKTHRLGVLFCIVSFWILLVIAHPHL